MNVTQNTTSARISVIIPVYNCEIFIDRCVTSLKNQSFQAWEAIFVNDGSTDKSREMLEAYAAADSRVRLINKENGGAASARNVGLDNVTTEYITMLDADDHIPETALEQMYNAAISTSCDLVVAPSTVQSDSGEYSVQCYCRTGYMENPAAFLFRNVYRGPVAKLYRRDIIERYYLRMPEDMVMAEDYIFVVSYWSVSKSVYAIKDSLYVYEYGDNPNSLIHRFCNKELPYEVYKGNAEAPWRVLQFMIANKINVPLSEESALELYRDHWLMGLNSYRYLDNPQEKKNFKQLMRLHEKDFHPYVPFMKRITMPHRYSFLLELKYRWRRLKKFLKR